VEDQRILANIGSMGKSRVVPRRRKIPKSLDKDCLEVFNRNWNKLCPYCLFPVSFDEFKTPEEEKEFNISGLCALCQDDIHRGVR